MHKARDLKREDIEFLNNLQFKMNTQDTIGQASPRFFVVIEDYKEWGLSSDYADDSCIVDDEGNEYYGDTLGEVLDSLSEDYDVGDYEVLSNGGIEVEGANGYIHDIFSMDDICLYIDEEFNEGLKVVYYRNTERVVPDTMFLTIEECEKHIKSNNYHYINPRCYAMTAWRSPEVSKLYEILENVVWEQLEVKGEINE